MIRWGRNSCQTTNNTQFLNVEVKSEEAKREEEQETEEDLVEDLEDRGELDLVRNSLSRDYPRL